MNSAPDLTQAATHNIERLFEDLPAKALLIAFGTLWATVPSVYLYAIWWMLLDLASGLVKAYESAPTKARPGRTPRSRWLSTWACSPWPTTTRTPGDW